jgi:hypothetical protein
MYWQARFRWVNYGLGQLQVSCNQGVNLVDRAKHIASSFVNAAYNIAAVFLIVLAIIIESAKSLLVCWFETKTANGVASAEDSEEEQKLCTQ